MNNTKNRVTEYEIVGKFDISKYTNEIKTKSKLVVLTERQKNHIIERHPEIIIYFNKIDIILNYPDSIYIQLDAKDTIWVIKSFKSNIKLTIKLITLKTTGIESTYENSIIQMQFMRIDEIKRNEYSGKIKKIFDIND